MGVGLQSPEPEFDPLAESTLLRLELQAAFANNEPAIEILWGSQAMVAVLVGYAALSGEAESAEPAWVGISNVVSDGAARAVVRLAEGPRVLRSVQALEGAASSDLDKSSAEQDAYFRYVLGRTTFSRAAAHGYTRFAGFAYGDRDIQASRMYDEYPGLIHYRDFHRYLRAKESGGAVESPDDEQQ
jgi:hypothetical protein